MDVGGFHEADRAFLDTARANGWKAFLCYLGDPGDGDAHRCVANRDGEVVFLTTGWYGPGRVTAEHHRDGHHRWVDPGRVGELLRAGAI